MDAEGKKLILINDIRFKGPVAKAKASASRGIPELINVATNGAYEPNTQKKHAKDGKKYLYDFLGTKKETG